MDIKDRGNKKWTALMLPEHREALERLFEEEIHERPELDEQRVEKLNRALTDAYRTGRPVRIRYWDDGEREAAGRITGFEMEKIRLAGIDGKTYINVNDVIGVEF